MLLGHKHPFLVFSYYEFSWKRNKGVSFDSLFQGMPVSLQADISLSLYKKIIDQVRAGKNSMVLEQTSSAFSPSCTSPV